MSLWSRGGIRVTVAAMIVECPGCKNRYDVTGRPAGTRARCRCGTIFVLPEPPAQASMLACPQCGGSVAATNHSCEFCAVELLVKACPRCFARMFMGSKHCNQCGASVIRPAAADLDGKAEKRKCPRCTSTFLLARLVGDVLLDECPDCLGIFVDSEALERILSERRQSRAEAVLGALGGLALTDQNSAPGSTQQGAMYVKCPDCPNLMNRRNFAHGARVVVDVCRDHGTWFDANELPQVIQFAMQGGLERADKRELERQREDLERAKRSMPAPGGAAAYVPLGGPSAGSLVADLLNGIARLIIR
jgi:Zn-finger nucleic acid-binding protein